MDTHHRIDLFSKWFNFLLLSLFFLHLSSCIDRNKREILKEPSCAKQSGFKICQDTFTLNISGFVTNGALHNGKYFLFFFNLKDKDKLGNQNPAKLYCISKNGCLLKEIPYPEPLESYLGCSFMIRNDSLIAYTQSEDMAFSLNTKTSKWTKVAYSQPIIYEDEKFRVSRICKGEFGGIVSFFDKKNGQIFDCKANCAVTVNKVNGMYYVTEFDDGMLNHARIIQIRNPRKLHKRETNPEKAWFDYLSSIKTDAVTLLENDDMVLKTSFQYRNNLYHFYSKDSTSAIGQLKNGKLSEKLNLPFFAHLEHRLNNNNQFLTFLTKRKFNFKDQINCGIMEIINGEIHIHHINPKVDNKIN